MSLLFDISPTDEPQPRKSKKPAPKRQADAEAAKASFVPAFRRLADFLGKIDGEVECLDQSCQGKCHDVTDKSRDQWRIECCCCGTGQWVDAREEPESEDEVGTTQGCFTFPTGRFIGLRLEEAATHPRWAEYCKYAAKNHADQAVRETCQKWLADNPAAC
jgi:hypothetical protein